MKNIDKIIEARFLLCSGNVRDANRILSECAQDKSVDNRAVREIALLLIAGQFISLGKKDGCTKILKNISFTQEQIENFISDDTDDAFYELNYVLDQTYTKSLLVKLYNEQCYNLIKVLYFNHDRYLARDLDILKIVASSLRAINELSLAKEIYQIAINKNIDDFELYNNLGNLLADTRNFGDAIKYLIKATTLNTDYYTGTRNLALCYYKANYPADAIELYKALENQKKYIKHSDFYSDFGDSYLALSEFENAILQYEKALSIDPKCTKTLNNLGTLFKFKGDLNTAEKYFKRALDIKPDYVDCLRNLIMTVSPDDRSNYIEDVNTCISSPNSEKDLVQLYFAKGEIEHSLGQYSKAFDSWSNGNQLRKKQLNYNVDRDLQINEIFRQLDISEPPAIINLNKVIQRPIFVVGMPRSGTTLVEQIISVNDNSFAAGELHHAANYINKHKLISKKVSRSAIQNFREDYLNAISEITDKNFVVDKMPLNFRFLNVLIEAFPEGKFLNIQRDPIAVCWSNFRILFTSTGNGFSHDLEDLVAFYKDYQVSMEKFHSKYPGTIYDVDYEALTQSPQSEVLKLTKYLGFRYSNKYLEFHKKASVVKTASTMQIRNGIYSNSSKKWREYEGHLKPLTQNFLS